MNAKLARDISRNSLTGPVIAPYLEVIYTKIKTATALGRNSSVHPFHGVAVYPSSEVVAAVKDRPSYRPRPSVHSDPERCTPDSDRPGRAVAQYAS
jgi:hypothetical protein